MRRLFYPALILLPVLAYAQAQAQTSTLNAPQSRASVATLEAKAETPNVLPAASAPASADPGTEIMVPVTQTVVERSSASAETKDGTPSNVTATATAPKLIEAKPLRCLCAIWSQKQLKPEWCCNSRWTLPERREIRR